MKCDEGRPVCHRCTSTGRICDGYGIWGGGETYHSQKQRLCETSSKDNRLKCKTSSPRVAPSILPTGADEGEVFEWFRLRTVTKIPGTFISGFWRTLVLQASVSDSAVLHAALALSDMHKTGIVKVDGDTGKSSARGFILQHYGQAIRQLQPHLTTKCPNPSSFRIALITCVLFICLDYLRGHFATARIHLRNGLKVLKEMKEARNTPIRGSDDSSDSWIIDAFSRLHLQAELFHQTDTDLYLNSDNTPNELVVLGFCTLHEAWKGLDRLILAILDLTAQARQQTVHTSSLIKQQQSIENGLANWWLAYDRYTSTLPITKTIDERKGYLIVRTYHTMATIMVATCLPPYNEMVYDACIAKFGLLITQLSGLWSTSWVGFSHERGLCYVGGPLDISHSLIDFGWIPPLYYVAIKCRDHRIRAHAIRFLELSQHREGIWDGGTMARVARRVMEIEEASSVDIVEEKNGCPLDELPASGKIGRGVPARCRLNNVEVILEGAPLDRVLLFARRDSKGRVLVGEFDVCSQQWVT